MKKLLLALLAIPTMVFAQNPFATVQIPLDCENQDIYGTKIQQLPNGNYFILGYVDLTTGRYPATIIQDEYGKTLKSTYYPKAEDITPYDFVINEAKNQIYITGRDDDFSSVVQYLSCVDYSGNNIWEKTHDITSVADRNGIGSIVLFKDRIIVQANMTRNGQGSWDDYMLSAFDLSGNLIDMQYLCENGNCGSKDEQFYSTIYWNNNFYSFGTNGASSHEPKLTAFDGNLNSTLLINGNTSTTFRAGLAHSNGNLIIGGENRFGNLSVLLSMNTSHSVVANKSFTVNGQKVYISDLFEDANKNIIVTGRYVNNTLAEEKVVIFSVDENLNYISGTAKTHVLSTKTGRKLYDHLGDGTILGFADVDYSILGSNQKTIESFVYKPGNDLCVFEDAAFSQSNNTITFSSQSLSATRIQPIEQNLGGDSDRKLLERHVCYPCFQTAPISYNNGPIPNRIVTPDDIVDAEAKDHQLTTASNNIKTNYQDNVISVYTDDATPITSYEIYSIKGDLIKSNKNIESVSLQIPVQLVSGMYIIKINNELSSKFIVK